MTDKDTMPKEIWAYENASEGYGGHWFNKPAPVDDGSDTVKYTRLSPDEFIVNRKELEGMKYTEDQGIDAEMENFNNAIDKILEMGE